MFISKKDYSLMLDTIKEQKKLINSLKIENSALTNLLYGDKEILDFPNSEK